MKIESQNKSWGFSGTTGSNCDAGPNACADAFARMGELLVSEFGISAETAQEFLDSRGGRHLADAVCHRNGTADVRFSPLPKWTRSEIRRMTGK